MADAPQNIGPAPSPGGAEAGPPWVLALQALQNIGSDINAQTQTQEAILAAIQTIAQNSGAGGNWVPILSFGGASTGITYSTQNGTYFMVGKLIVVSFSIVLTSKGSANGAALISGLPATCGAVPGTVAISSHANFATNNVFESQVTNGATAIALGKGDAAASAALVDTDFDNNTAISGTAIYIST